MVRKESSACLNICRMFAIVIADALCTTRSPVHSMHSRYMLHSMCYTLCAMRSTLRTMLYTRDATCYMLHVTHCTLHAPCYMLHASCAPLYVTHHTTHSIPRTALDATLCTQHAACWILPSTRSHSTILYLALHTKHCTVHIRHNTPCCTLYAMCYNALHRTLHSVFQHICVVCFNSASASRVHLFTALWSSQNCLEHADSPRTPLAHLQILHLAARLCSLLTTTTLEWAGQPLSGSQVLIYLQCACSPLTRKGSEPAVLKYSTAANLVGCNLHPRCLCQDNHCLINGATPVRIASLMLDSTTTYQVNSDVDLTGECHCPPDQAILPRACEHIIHPLSVSQTRSPACTCIW
jgi:hypothetical protein